MRLQEIEAKSSKFFELTNGNVTIEQDYELFVDALQSEDFFYTREQRASEYSNVYFVRVFLKDDNSPTGRWGVASLPKDLALKAIHDHGRSTPRGSLI